MIIFGGGDDEAVIFSDPVTPGLRCGIGIGAAGEQGRRGLFV
jgi:hypothetical protein